MCVSFFIVPCIKKGNWWHFHGVLSVFSFCFEICFCVNYFSVAYLLVAVCLLLVEANRFPKKNTLQKCSNNEHWAWMRYIVVTYLYSNTAFWNGIFIANYRVHKFKNLRKKHTHLHCARLFIKRWYFASKCARKSLSSQLQHPLIVLCDILNRLMQTCIQLGSSKSAKINLENFNFTPSTLHCVHSNALIQLAARSAAHTHTHRKVNE